MTRRIPTLAGWLTTLALTACASTSQSTSGESTDSTAQPTTGTEVTAAPSPPATPPPPPSEQAPGALTQVTGSVMYRERIALTPDAVLSVEVAELTPEGKPGDIISQQVVKGPGQVPIPFSLAINPQRIRAEATYVVTARITDGTRTFSTTTPIPVLTQGARSSDVQVLLRSGH